MKYYKIVFSLLILAFVSSAYAELDANITVRTNRVEGKTNQNITLKSYHEVHFYNNSNYPYTFSYSFILRCDPGFKNYGRQITLKPHEHYDDNQTVEITVNKHEPGKYQILSQSMLFNENGDKVRYNEDGRLLVITRN